MPCLPDLPTGSGTFFGPRLSGGCGSASFQNSPSSGSMFGLMAPSSFRLIIPPACLARCPATESPSPLAPSMKLGPSSLIRAATRDPRYTREDGSCVNLLLVSSSFLSFPSHAPSYASEARSSLGCCAMCSKKACRPGSAMLTLSFGTFRPGDTPETGLPTHSLPSGRTGICSGEPRPDDGEEEPGSRSRAVTPGLVCAWS
mmetsp:Transcript_10380/g.47611  ORF Transcript_10380/g.47611 Transcript_10380/m.47611 type:complete len:201 (-) Transcript_10380:152-754(-)